MQPHQNTTLIMMAYEVIQYHYIELIQIDSKQEILSVIHLKDLLIKQGRRNSFISIKYENCVRKIFQIKLKI